MDRPTHPVARLTPAIVATLAALAFTLTAATALAPAALANAPANDEYVLEIPGVRLSPTDSASQAATSPQAGASAAARQGVVGETDPPPSQLDSLLSTLGSLPGVLLAGLAAFVALGLIAPVANRRTVHGAR